MKRNRVNSVLNVDEYIKNNRRLIVKLIKEDNKSIDKHNDDVNTEQPEITTHENIKSITNLTELNDPTVVKLNRTHLKRRNSIDKNFLILNIEQELANRLYILFELNFLINLHELRCIVKLYLDRRGIRIRHFPLNMPTFDYVENFLQRNILVKKKFINKKNLADMQMLPVVEKLVKQSKFIEIGSNQFMDDSVLLDGVIVDLLTAKYKTIK